MASLRSEPKEEIFAIWGFLPLAKRQHQILRCAKRKELLSKHLQSKSKWADCLGTRLSNRPAAEPTRGRQRYYTCWGSNTVRSRSRSQSCRPENKSADKARQGVGLPKGANQEAWKTTGILTCKLPKSCSWSMFVGV